MRFTDFLRLTVLLTAAAATAMGAVTVATAAARGDRLTVIVGAVWWLCAAAFGLWSGQKAEPSPRIRSLLADARAATALPEPRPSRTLLNRLWPLLAVAAASVGVAWLVPQVPAVGAGYAILWSLLWRRQESAVSAIEERDGVQFYIEPTSPLRGIKLLRTRGWTREL